jgi:hypothetical protein
MVGFATDALFAPAAGPVFFAIFARITVSSDTVDKVELDVEPASLSANELKQIILARLRARLGTE